ncbi:hypothetical protein H634G_03647 [Metarhizium anisopliae BRIP 53293]|uniref:Uncharacterized protein n=1 Tax=Metarhizium anisopliae BRIP 53293 TaxID=1291518 RepID=A0A0D9P4R4_METAN|nr:hypothetical protein H634G_03647 [Metarhizium anisopliae BRIP 53293]KJK95337.1 hypothetical protein H633G_00846 [Metarhizium anisopliae BRIP 53284]
MKEGYEHEDDAQLAAMGHRPELQRNFSTLSMLGLAFAVLNVSRHLQKLTPAMDTGAQT